MTRPTGKHVGLDIREDVAFITLDSPPLNILTAPLMDEMTDAMTWIEGEHSLKAVVVRAKGKVFSAGADVDEHRPEKVGTMVASLGRLFRALDACELPVVMAAHGAALGAGFELVLMADVLLAADGAGFGLPEIRLGFFPPIAAVLLPERVGSAKALEMCCSGRKYSASEMKECGFVTRTMPVDELDEAVEQVLRDFRSASPLILRMNVRMLKRLRSAPFVERLQTAERVFLEDLMSTRDVREGIASFVEKRPPVWKNA